MNHPELLRLIDQAGFIFRGRAMRQQTADAPANATAPKGARVLIEEILLSVDSLRGFTGKEVFLVSEQPAALPEGKDFLFFTNCLAVGGHVVVRELAHVEWSSDELRQVGQMAADRPLQNRVAAADLIVTGRVIRCGPVKTKSIRKSEHDPEWWIARVEVESAIRGESESREVDVLFANSRDIAWYKAPKLRKGTSGVFILQHLETNEAPTEVARPIYQVVDPLDALPAERLPDVQRAHDRIRGGR